MIIKKIPSNLVAIKIQKPSYDTIETKVGELYINPNFNFAQHVVHSGEVVAVPEKLIFDRKDPNRGMRYKVNMELKVGDYVWGNRREFAACLGSYCKDNDKYSSLHPDKFIENEDGTLTIFIRYDELWIAKRGEEYMPLNGWLIIEGMEEEDPLKGTGLIFPESFKKGYSTKVGIVKYAGERVEEYMNDKCEDSYNITVGDKVFLPKYSDIVLENELHSQLKLGTHIFVTQRHRLVSSWDDLKQLLEQAGHVDISIDDIKVKIK